MKRNNITKLLIISLACFTIFNSTSYSVSSAAISESQLRSQLIAQVNIDQGSKGIVRTYTASEAIDIILSNDSTITEVSNIYNVNKAMIQAILLREITCIYAADVVADSAVWQTFAYLHDREAYDNLQWWEKLAVGVPQPPPLMLDDSSTGLGQITAKTAMKALNYEFNTTIYDFNNWKMREVIWNNLKTNDYYNIRTVARVLKYEANGRSLANPSQSVAVSVMGAYNGNTAYGNLVYKYYTIFKSYNS